LISRKTRCFRSRVHGQSTIGFGVQPRAELMERAAHGAHRDALEAATLELLAEKLARPCRAHPAEVRRASSEHGLEREQVLRRDLPIAVVAARVIQALAAVAQEPSLRPRHVRDRDVEEAATSTTWRKTTLRFAAR
jgi:hypothetical protein